MDTLRFDKQPLVRFLRAQPRFAGGVLPTDVDDVALDLPDRLVARAIVTREEMRACLEDFYGVPAPDLETVEPDPEALALLPETLCRQLHVLPLLVSDDQVVVTMADPWNLDARAMLEFKTGKQILAAVALASDLLAAIKAFYETSEQLGRAIQNLVRAQQREADPRKARAELSDLALKDAPVVKLVDYILRQGVTLGASDIHLEPHADQCVLRYRIDGVLHAFEGPPLSIYPEVISRIKVMASLDAAEGRVPQDGRLTWRHGDRQVELRVSTLPLVHGEGACLRILDKSGVNFDLRRLGFPEMLLPLYQQAAHSPHGLIIVSGPTGSGKSTTLYATLAEIATPDKKVITVEDPVEYRTDVACQSAVRPDVGYTFASGLRAILRHDPDIIMIGEMRDRESAEIAIRAALTGHLVLSTLHTNDSVSVVSRLVDMGVPHYLVSATLRLVISQRLVRLLCPRCRSAKWVTRAMLENAGASPALLADVGDEARMWEPAGCDACNHIGYLGRSAIFEVLDTRLLFRNLRDRQATLQELTEMALRQGLVTLRDWGLDRAMRGETSLEEVLKVTADIEYAGPAPAVRPVETGVAQP